MPPFVSNTLTLFFSVFTLRAMPLAAYSKLYSRDSAMADVFERNDRSSAHFNVILCAEYFRLLFFINVKPFSFIRFSNVCRT